MAAEETPTPQKLDIARYRERYLGPLVALLLVLQTIAFVAQLAYSMPTPWDLSFPEAAVTARAADVARGEVPYHDWREWPHAFAPYGPLTYYVVGVMGRATSAVGQTDTLRWLGRLQSFGFLIGIAAIVMIALRQAGLSWGDKDGCLEGMVTMADLSEALFDLSLDEYVTAGEMARPPHDFVEAGSSLDQAVAAFGEAAKEPFLPVVQSRRSMKLVGILTEREVMLAQQRALLKARAEEKGEE